MHAYRMGIDIGSTTAKITILNESNKLIYSTYRRHNAKIIDTLSSALQEATETLDNVKVTLLVTGSAGLGLSEKFNLPFIQEVVASAEVVRQLYPQVKTLIDIGGEDAKIIFFNANGAPDIRMNGACAGGTGAFIDQMATLLNIPTNTLNDLAQNHTTVYPIASRCGVFAKTDVQNLLSREVAQEDIAASIFNAVVLQTLATLARGHTPESMILFSGGPLTFLPALKEFFMQALHVKKESILDIPHAELLPAFGAALAHADNKQLIHLEELSHLLTTPQQKRQLEQNRLPILFKNKADFSQWQSARTRQKTPRVPVDQMDGKSCFLGVDSGSTTTKLVLIDTQGRLIFDHYRNNHGNAINAVQEGLKEIQHLFATHSTTPHIKRSIVTGYGEDLIKAAFGFDEGMVETLAHYRAAKAFEPNVSFILDIGGQDMKAIFVNDGHIQNIEINEACSSGCGSFIESFARSMEYTVADFAQEACMSQAPCDLGTRCTVFMNSKVKQSLRERAGVDDISAGLAYSVIKNAIHKVLKITDPAVLGDHVVVQGGTFRNPAVHKAMEQLLEKEVLCPDISELMGAYGAALTARDTHQTMPQENSQLINFDRLETVGDSIKHTIRCKGCENLCTITKLTFPNKNTFFTGNRCERIFTNSGKKVEQGTNLFDLKYRLLFDTPAQANPPTDSKLTIGIPRVLNMYENFPFWQTLFNACGLTVKLSDTSDNALYQKGVATIMSENICFPAKLVHGHIYNLIEAGVGRIFYPMVVFEKQEFPDALNCFNCPIVSGYPDVVRSAIDPAKNFGIPLDQIPITFNNERLLKKNCRQYLTDLGVSAQTFNKAFTQALQAQKQFKNKVQQLGTDTLEKANKEGRPVMLLMGRPYHLDPLIHHGVPQILADFGVDVITEDALPPDVDPILDNQHVLTQWEYPNRYYHAARWAGQQKNINLVQLNSFGCGPDAVAVDEVKSILEEYGKSHTVIRIDEIESTGSVKLRLRSMIESLKQEQSPAQTNYTPRRRVKTYQKEDRKKTILAPQFSYFYSAPLTRPLVDLGYTIETLPAANRASTQTGLKYTNNEICYPAIILIGDIIKGLQSGRYDLDNVAVGITQTGGQCRASSYLSLLKRALLSAGFDNVPIVSITTGLQPLNAQPGFKLNIREYAYKTVLGIIYADALASMYYASIIREIQPGQTLALTDKYLALLKDGTLPLNKSGVLDLLQQAVADFNRLKTKQKKYPKVGLVGEIYAKYNAFANNRVAQWLIDQELEVVVPPLLEFFAAWPVNTDTNVKSNIKNPDLPWLLSLIVKKYIRSFMQDVDAVMKNFKHYHPHHSIDDIAHKAQDIVKMTHQYGEGWLIPGEVGTFAQDGINNVLCLQPFGCIANHVVAKGVEKKLKETYPNLNMLFLDADAGLSEVNFFNRLYFFINQAKTAEVNILTEKHHLHVTDNTRPLFENASFTM